MGGRVRVVAWALAAAVAWGMLLAWWYEASLVRGALVGLWAWGPAIVLSVHWRAVPVDDVPLDTL